MKELIEKYGLEGAWNIILSSTIYPEEKWGGLYEESLAIVNKIEKKAMGKYYTPDDVASVMAHYLSRMPQNIVCDFCCGTGNLILAVLAAMPREEAVAALHEGRIYVYDIDSIAIRICGEIVRRRYGHEPVMEVCDCFAADFHFPSGAKVISNPPYGKLNKKEQYVAAMEKILEEDVPAVIITPHSFMGGSSFQTLRNKMSKKGGTIFSFDNVPGNIFKGKKYGIFNSNAANSTRAAITIIEPQEKGFLVSPFIRFKTEERAKVLEPQYLNSLLPRKRQTGFFYRYSKEDEDWVWEWLAEERRFGDLLADAPTEWRLDFSNSCRYFTVATKRSLDRVGKHMLYFRNEEDWMRAYAILNSVLCYYWHRMCDGGISYSLSLLRRMPIPAFDVPYGLVQQMMQEEENYLVYKKNAGKEQESVKFPAYMREQLFQLPAYHVF